MLWGAKEVRADPLGMWAPRQGMGATEHTHIAPVFSPTAPCEDVPQGWARGGAGGIFWLQFWVVVCILKTVANLILVILASFQRWEWNLLLAELAADGDPEP